MELYRFYGYIYGDRVVGIVRANSELEAEENLKKEFKDCDYDLWQNKKLEKVEFSNNNVLEVFYG